MIKIFCIILATLWAFFPSNVYSQENVETKPIIEHDGDRYVIDVSAMKLGGEETILDVLKMCPEFTITDHDHLLENYTLRTCNIPLKLDIKSYLSNTRAKDISKIEICNNTNVVKGTDGTNGVIDIYFVQKPLRPEGRVNTEYTSDGRFSGSLELRHHTEKLHFRFHVQGKDHDTYHDYQFQDLDYTKYDFTVRNRERGEYATMGVSYSINRNTMLCVNLNQKYTVEKTSDTEGTYGTADSLRNHYVGASLDFRHIFKDNSVILFEAIIDRNNIKNNSIIPVYQDTRLSHHNTNLTPSAYLEYDFSVWKNMLKINTGTEIGHKHINDQGIDFYHDNYSVTIGDQKLDYVINEKSRYDCVMNYTYEDIYAQANFRYRNFGLTAGERYRWIQYDFSDNRIPDEVYKTKRHTNTYVFSVLWNINKHHAVQATHNHKLHTPQPSDLIICGANLQPLLKQTNILGYEWKDLTKETDNDKYKYLLRNTRHSEFVYTFQSKYVNTMAKVLNIKSDDGYDKTSDCGVQASAWFHKGGFNVWMGADIFNKKMSNIQYTSRHSQKDFFFSASWNINQKNSWVLQGTFAYNSGYRLEHFYTVAESYYAFCKCQKFFDLWKNTRIRVYAEYHATINRHSRRACTIGCGYIF